MKKKGSWDITRELLSKAANYFSEIEKNNEKFKEYESFFREDEFELAIESLEALLLDLSNQKDEFWIWNYLRTACENMGLTEKEQYFREIITEIILKKDKSIQIENPDVVGEVKYLSWLEGGKISPVASGYRAQFKYDHFGEWSALQQLKDKPICFPDETVTINFKFYVDNVHKRKFYKNQPFEIREGSSIVGIGKILEIPREEYKRI